MSAFIVSQKHIQYLITAAIDYQVIVRDSEQTGQLLWDENVKSVNYRYPTDPQERYIYHHKPFCVPPINPIIVIKQCHCYAYQSCEHPEWETSEAKRLIDALEANAIRRVAGYDSAPWGID